MRFPMTIGILTLLAALGCGDSAAPEATGAWGGPEAMLVLAPQGGTVEFACGFGTIDAGWSLGPGGRWTATGQYFAGGGPLPPGGSPPHPATYAGTFRQDLLTFTVTVADLATNLGPFRVRRGAPGPPVVCL